MTSRARFISILTAVFLSDRLTKFIILKNYKEGQSFPVFPGVLHVTRVDNTGAAFGIFQGASLMLIVVSALFIIFFGIYFFRHSNSLSRTAFYAAPLITAGALGNLYDRVFYGHVVDFIDLRIWPVFNLADTGICVGAGLIILGLLKQRSKGN